MNEKSVATMDSGGKALAELMEIGFLSKEELQAMPIGTRIMFSPPLKNAFIELSRQMAGSDGTPTHLKGDVDGCFNTIRLALNCNMDFYQLAQHTFSPSKGKIAIDGTAAVGMMLGSKRVKTIRHEHYGDWDKIAGKFKMEQGKWPDGNPKKDKKGNPIMEPVADWAPEDEQGLYIITTAVMGDGTEVSTPKIFLNQCQPRNSTQWPLAPARQILNVGARAIQRLACADLLLGIPVNDGLYHPEEQQPMRVVNPEPVDVEAEGIQGTGEVEPGTSNGFAGVDGFDGPDDYERGPDKKTRKRIKITFQGQDYYKTKFMTDVGHMLREVDDDGFDQLVDDLQEAVASIEDPEAKVTMENEIDELITKAENRLNNVNETDNAPKTQTLNLAEE